MRAPTTWLAELVGLDATPAGLDVARDLVRVGLEEEGLSGREVRGPLVVGRVVDKSDEPQKNGKTIHFCHVDVGCHGQRAEAGGDETVTQEIVCGAHNFEAGDLVIVCLPGAVLAGGFEISSRRTYGHPSNGMICSERELGIGEDHDGIIVLSRFFADDPELVASLEPGDDVIGLMGLDQEVVEVNVTPDRGYCFSMRGIAREYALALGRPGAFVDPVGPQAVQPPPATGKGYEVRLVDESRIHGQAGCDRYVARIVRGVDASATSPAWLRLRLVQMGMRPISLAVDVTNYLMLLTGQPLHAFDLDTLSGAIEVRRARSGETLTTLDDVVRTLDAQDLLITDGGSVPLAIAGVMGGATSEVTGATRNVLIEAAHFDPVSIARSSRRHKLSTEASKRFERGVDSAMTASVAELAARMLVAHGGGVADAEATDLDRREPTSDVTFDTVDAWRLIEPGSPPVDTPPEGLDHDSVVEALRAIGCGVQEITHPTTAGGGNGFGHVRVVSPPWRPDLLNGPDLIEEIARIRGYEHIPSVLPVAPGGRGLTRAQRVSRNAHSALAGLGLTEVWSYPFITPELFDQLGYGALDPRRDAVRLANPLADTHPLLRTAVLDSLLGALRLNVGRGLRDVGLFEVGTVFRARTDGAKAPPAAVGVRPDEKTLQAMLAAVPSQPYHVAWALTGAAETADPFGPARMYQAGDAISYAMSLGRALGVTLRPEAERDQAPWHAGRCARILTGEGAVVGYAGELHPKVCAALELPIRSCAGELDLDALVEAGGVAVQVTPLSTFPLANTDVALVVDEAVPAASVEAALHEGAGAELEALVLFDVYRGDQVGDGRKSLAYRLTFRAADRTLTTEEVSAARDRAVARAREATGADQRS